MYAGAVGVDFVVVVYAGGVEEEEDFEVVGYAGGVGELLTTLVKVISVMQV